MIKLYFKIRIYIIITAAATNSAQDSNNNDSLDDLSSIKDILFKIKYKEASNFKRKVSQQSYNRD